jgi:hypothetical protein
MLIMKAKSVICVTKASGKKKGCNVHPIKGEILEAREEECLATPGI